MLKEDLQPHEDEYDTAEDLRPALEPASEDRSDLDSCGTEDKCTEPDEHDSRCYIDRKERERDSDSESIDACCHAPLSSHSSSSSFTASLIMFAPINERRTKAIQ